MNPTGSDREQGRISIRGGVFEPCSVLRVFGESFRHLASSRRRRTGEGHECGSAAMTVADFWHFLLLAAQQLNMAALNESRAVTLDLRGSS